jgi:hypothetical protein
MHAVITQAIAAERARELHAHAAVAGAPPPAPLAARRPHLAVHPPPACQAHVGLAVGGPATARPEGSLSPGPANRP